MKSAQGFTRSFAPNWELVMGCKNGTLTKAEYTEQYMKILGAVSVEAWCWLNAQAAEGGEVVMLRYCRDGWFCHTRLIMQYAVEKYPQTFSKK